MITETWVSPILRLLWQVFRQILNSDFLGKPDGEQMGTSMLSTDQHTIRAVLHSFRVVPPDTWTLDSSTQRSFCVEAEAYIGQLDGKGADLFQFSICSPQWLLDHVDQNGRFLRHFLILNTLDEFNVQKKILEIVESARGESWLKVAEILGRYMFWEFEDYLEYKPTTP
jgi:Immunity protein 8